MSGPSAPDCAAARAALEAFLDAGNRHDEAAMRALVSKRTLEGGHLDASAGPEGVRFVTSEPRVEGGQVVIDAQAYPTDAPDGTPPVMVMPCRMVQEDGAWKFDLAGTLEGMMGDVEAAMEQAVGQVAGALSEAMEGVGQAMADGFREAFGEGGAPAVEDVSLTPAADELRALPSLTTLPKTQAAVTEAVGSPVLFEAALDALLAQAGSDESEVLVNWFEDQLFAGWSAMLAEVAQRVPLKDRLRAVRIDSVRQPENRTLVLDGSDLVYRMCLPMTEGFFQDDDVQTMLPGVLAGLPEHIDESVAGYRLLPNEDEHPDLDLYRERVAPRYTARIRALVGPVSVDLDWDQLRDISNASQVLAIWGLNRIYGGLVLACQDPALREQLTADIARIIVVMNSEVARRSASYADGTLEVGISFYGLDHRGAYEYEIAQALAGNPVE